MASVTIKVSTFLGRPSASTIAVDGGFYEWPKAVNPPRNQPGARRYPNLQPGSYQGTVRKLSRHDVTLRVGTESFRLEGPLGCM